MMKDPARVYNYMKDIRDFAQEAFFVLTLTQKLQIINYYMVSLGTAVATLVHPREVFRPAIFDGAVKIMCVHNHPSGDPAPSRQDRDLTSRLREAGTLIGIRITDHIIIGTSYFSFQEHGLV